GASYIRWSLVGLATAAIFAAGDAHAAGFQVNEQNARGLGSPFAGDAASAEEAGTIIFNPAGLTPRKRTQFVAGGFAIKPTANFHDNGSTVRAAKRLTFRVGQYHSGPYQVAAEG